MRKLVLRAFVGSRSWLAGNYRCALLSQRLSACFALSANDVLPFFSALAPYCQLSYNVCAGLVRHCWRKDDSLKQRRKLTNCLKMQKLKKWGRYHFVQKALFLFVISSSLWSIQLILSLRPHFAVWRVRSSVISSLIVLRCSSIIMFWYE